MGFSGNVLRESANILLCIVVSMANQATQLEKQHVAVSPQKPVQSSTIIHKSLFSQDLMCLPCALLHTVPKEGQTKMKKVSKHRRSTLLEPASS